MRIKKSPRESKSFVFEVVKLFNELLVIWGRVSIFSIPISDYVTVSLLLWCHFSELITQPVFQFREGLFQRETEEQKRFHCEYDNRDRL
jgi:hypothetical protein